MTVEELIDKLFDCEPDAEVLMFDYNEHRQTVGSVQIEEGKPVIFP